MSRSGAAPTVPGRRREHAGAHVVDVPRSPCLEEGSDPAAGGRAGQPPTLPPPTLDRMGWPSAEMPPWIPRALLYFFLGLAAPVGRLLAADKLSDLLLILVVSLFLSFALEPAVD